MKQRIWAWLSAILFVTSLSPTTNAQTIIALPAAGKPAREWVSQWLARRMPGQPNDLTVQGKCSTSTSDGQSTGASSRFKWTYAGGEFLYETWIDGKHSAMGSGHGSPWSRRADGTVSQPRTANGTGAHLVPAVLLSEQMADPSLRFESKGTASLNGTSKLELDVYSSSSNTEPTAVWYFDPTTLDVSILHLRITGSRSNAYALQLEISFGSALKQAPIPAPESVRIAVEGRVTSQQCSIEDVEVNTAPPSSTFDQGAAR